MKKYVLPGVMLLCLGASAQINSTGDAGLLARAAAMAAENNYTGALDQLRNIDKCALTPAQAEETAFMTARCLYESGRYADAYEAYRSFETAYPFAVNGPEARFGAASCLYAQGRYADALAAFRKCDAGALGRHDAALIAYRKGVSALHCGHKAEARAAFGKAAAYGATRQASLFYLGRLDFEDGDYRSARERLSGLTSNVPPADMAPFYLAQIDFVEGNYAKALSTARQVLRREGLSKEASAEMNRVAGESAYRLGQRADAVAFLKKYLGQAAEPAPSALYILGLDDFENGRYDDALYRFRPVTEQAKGALRQSAYLYAGQCLLEQGDASAAILAFDKAAKATDDPGVREAAFYNYAVAKFAGADVPFASASETFEEFLKLYPSGTYSDRVASFLAAGYMADKDYARALERINAIASPDASILKAKQRVLYSLGLDAVRAGDTDAAARYLDQAAALSRHDAAVAAEVTLAQAELAQATGRNADAAAKYHMYLRMAGRNAANRPQALYGLAYALYGGGNATRAEEYFSEALKVLPQAEAKADVLSRLGDIYFAKSDFDGAAAFYARAFAANPVAGDYPTLSGAKMKGYMRDYEGKLRLLDAFRKDFASSALMPEALLETTQAQISLGRNEAALATYKELIDKYPLTEQGRRGYLQMAMTLLDMDRREEAAQAYRSVISLYPTSQEAAQAASLLKNLYSDEGRADEFLRFMAGVGNAPAIDSDEAEALSYKSAVKAYENRGATDQLEAFAARYPKSKHYSDALGLLLDHAVGAGDKTAASTLARRINEECPDSRASERALRYLASSAYATGDLPGALALWQKLAAKASRPDIASEARLGVMRTARDMGDYDTAIAAADDILSSANAGDGATEARFTKAMALSNRGKIAEALAIWKELAADPAGIFGARSAFEAASALNEQGDSKGALAMARKLTGSGSPQRYWVARAFILISDIYTAQGKDFEAKEYLEALRDNYPGTETDIFMMIDSRLSSDKE